MSTQENLKKRLLKHLRGGEAFVPLRKVLDGLDHRQAGDKPDLMAHTIYDLVYHLYRGMKNINDYLLDENYEAIEWPADYWPDTSTPDSETWENAKTGLWKELERAETILKDEQTDLFAQIPWGATGHTQLRGILLIIEHNAYHTGQMLYIRRAIGAW